MAETMSDTRKEAAQGVAAVLRAHPGATIADLRIHLYAAYPFGERQGWEYDAWQQEVRAALASLELAREEAVPR
jgi:hypothetical protein